MLKSLFSGVSGLQSHQIAMDVESNNIANVNTTGFKYSRANFSDLLAQTKSIATAPQGALGGKNAVQVGLGSTVSSMTRIFSQGSVQNSDKNTDMAIQGDGFFIISPDGGNTYKYTRSGDFKFDAGGNFVDNNGFIAQGWLRDEVTGEVDSTAPITNINIAPGLTTPANPSSEVVLKANLNSGPLIESYSAAYPVPSGIPNSVTNPGQGDAIDDNGNPIASGNMGVMFNEVGEAFSLQNDQGVWASFRSAMKTDGVAVGPAGTTYTFSRSPLAGDTISVDYNGVTYSGATYAALETDLLTEPSGTFTSLTITGDAIVLNTTAGSTPTIANVINDGAGGAAVTVTETGIPKELDITLTLDNGDTLDIATSGATGSENAAQNAARYVSAINAESSTTGVSARYDVVNGDIELTNTNGATTASHNIRLIVNSGDNSGMSTGTVTTAYRYQYDSAGSSSIVDQDKTFTTISDLRYALETQAHSLSHLPTTVSATVTAGTTATDNAFNISIGGTLVAVAATGAASTADANGASYAAAITAAGITGITATYDTSTDQLIITNTGVSSQAVVINAADSGRTGLVDGSLIGAAGDSDSDGISNENNIKVIVDEQGKLKITNPGGSDDADYDMNLKITGLTASGVVGGGITENTNFTRNLEALNAVLPTAAGGQAYSQSFNAATHSSSIDVFDSLGSKHTLRMEFRKTALDTATGSTWDMTITVPQPSTIDTVAPTYEKTGSVRFNNDGSLATYNPPNLSFSGNNGSAPNQQINLSFGTANAFDGMTSFDSLSTTSGISQDGYTGGDLVGIRIDQSGTLVGSFSNGRSFGLAQVAMAKFTNNEGLGTEGGNIFIQSANSGDPIIGTAATAGRGFIQSSALEASNVDLSRALTQLIIIQRGFQANGKTITTSDQLLQTLIGLKNDLK